MMNDLRKKLKKLPLLKFFSSIKITVACLFLLFILTLWGTIAQVSIGLYQAQLKYFYSFFFLVWGFLPFPGTQLVLWILFFNLLAVASTRFVYKWSSLGIIVIHIGLITYFVAAFITFRIIEESHVTLLEGSGTNVSQSFYDMELSVWPDENKNLRDVSAYDTNNLKSGDQLSFDHFGFSIRTEAYHPNADAYIGAADNADPKLINDTGIRSIKQKVRDREPEKNLAGAIFEISDRKDDKHRILLYAGESSPTALTLNGKKYYFQLRKKRYQLPFFITLKEFTKEEHPGTQIAKSFKSLVMIKHQNLRREHLIFMNNPLLYKDYALYQASYSIDSAGRERSTLAVVKNAGRLLPYISTLAVSLGLLIHFLMMAFSKKRKYA